jgi:alkylhydroperoxidase family enzyme
VTLEEEMVAHLKRDWRSAPGLTDQERVMLDYVEQLTRDAVKIHPGYHERLRAAGFDDRGILQITLIACWFNYINRVADSLGIGRLPATTPDVAPPTGKERRGEM